MRRSNIGLNGSATEALLTMYENYDNDVDSDGFKRPKSEREWRVVEDTIREYKLIQKKESKLSRMERDKIKRTVMLWELKGLVKFTEKGCEIL